MILLAELVTKDIKSQLCLHPDSVDDISKLVILNGQPFEKLLEILYFFQKKTKSFELKGCILKTITENDSENVRLMMERFYTNFYSKRIYTLNVSIEVYGIESIGDTNGMRKYY